MRKNLTTYIATYITTSACFVFIFFTLLQPVSAAFLQLEPGNITVRPNEEFTLDLRIDTEGESASTIDAIVNFDASIIEVLDITLPENDPPFFHEQSLIELIREDNFYIGASITPSGENFPRSQSGEGAIATIRARGIAQGQTHLDFRCEPGSTNDSNISVGLGSDILDLIDCEKLMESDIVVTGTPITPSPTVTPSPSVSPSPHPCPEKIETGDYNCDNTVDLSDFEVWRQDFEKGAATLAEFEHFRRAFLDTSSN